MKSIPLVAARKFEVGTVSVSNDANNVLVRFQSDMIPGCLLYEVRARLADGLTASGVDPGIPQNQGNLVPGLFTHRAPPAASSATPSRSRSSPLGELRARSADRARGPRHPPPRAA